VTDHDDIDLEGLEQRHQHAAVEDLNRALFELEQLTAFETARGRKAVYGAWAAHLRDDWRGIALLAARVEPGDAA
jgi:hypothetical protein